MPTIGNDDRYIYFDPDLLDLSDPSLGIRGLQICETQGSGIDTGSCQPLATDGDTSNNVCYNRVDADPDATPPRPYYEVNCRLSEIDAGNATVFIDTSNVRINFFFDESSPASDYISVAGNTEFKRVHCRPADSDVIYDVSGYATSRCQSFLEWNDPTSAEGDFQTLCTVNGSKCGLDSGNLDYFDNSELLNIYAFGASKITLNGTTEGMGFNIYAPFTDLKFNGDVNFMGRLLTDGFDARGRSVSIRVLNSPPSAGVVTGLTGVDDLWDFRARSFTQSSGFGL